MLLDSNMVIYAAQGAHPAAVELVMRQDACITSISLVEILGFHRFSELSLQERSALERLTATLIVLPLEDRVIRRAIALRQARRHSLADALIAATALVHGKPLATRNVRDFEAIPDLELINPFGVE